MIDDKVAKQPPSVKTNAESPHLNFDSSEDKST